MIILTLYSWRILVKVDLKLFVDWIINEIVENNELIVRITSFKIRND